MTRVLPTLPLLALTIGCTVRDRGENSAVCGITMLAAATIIIDQVTQPYSAVTEPPEELMSGVVPARVVGYGTTAAVTGAAEDGSIVVGYTGPGFPDRPGFGVALIDDSSEVFHGILIWDKDPPPDEYPTIGTITDANTVMPLIGVRIDWGSVTSERCPLFAEVDSTIP